MGMALMSLTAYRNTCGNRVFSALAHSVGAGGYDYHLKTQKDQVDQDHKDGEIAQKERDIRIVQFRRDSLVQ